MAVEYAKVGAVRRTIGTFQAVKHHAANMLVNAEQTTAATWDAARPTTLDSASVSCRRRLPHTPFAPRSSTRAVQHSTTRRHRLHLGAQRAHVLRRAAPWPPSWATEPTHYYDVVDGQRSGQAHGASFTVAPRRAEEIPQGRPRRRQPRCARCRRRQRRDFLVDSGYLVPQWPTPWGRAAGGLEQLVIEEEFQGVDRADIGHHGWVTLTIAPAGTTIKRERWVDTGLRGQVMWCQLFSEPGAGSDAARPVPYHGQEGRRWLADHRTEGGGPASPM